MRELNDLKIILSYEIKMKIREMKSMIKNLFIGLVIIAIVFIFIAYQFGSMIILNLDLINLYRNYIVLGISTVFIIFTIICKKSPLVWRPASMIFLSGSNFQNILKVSLFNKIISHVILGVFLALILNNFKINFQLIQVFLTIWNLFTISVTSRYFFYNKGLNIKMVGFLLIYTIAINLQLYINKYLSIILISYLTYLAILSILKILNMNLSFDKSFKEMVFINRSNHLARGNIIEDAQEFVREISAEKSKKNPILKNIKFKNPLIQKNLITFSRINLSMSVYIFAIFAAIIISYQFELFEFVKTIKKLDLGISIVALHQALLINNIINLIIDQKNLLVVKSKKGLYLPYKKYEIIKSFMALGVPVLSFIILMVGILFRKSIWKMSFEVLLYSIILLISLSHDKKKASDLFATAIYFVIFGVSYLLIK